LAVSYPLLAVSCSLLAVSCWLSALGFWLSALGFWLSAAGFCCPLLAVRYQITNSQKLKASSQKPLPETAKN